MIDKRWPIARKLYKMFIKYSVWMKEGGKKAEFYKKGIMIAPDMEAQTSTIVMPLNVDITEESEKVVVPFKLNAKEDELRNNLLDFARKNIAIAFKRRLVS